MSRKCWRYHANSLTLTELMKIVRKLSGSLLGCALLLILGCLGLLCHACLVHLVARLRLLRIRGLLLG